MNPPNAIRVFIRNLAGEYLCCEGDQWSFKPDRSQAQVLDYHADEVAVQLEQARRDLGVTWVAVPVDPRDVGETCDACGHRMLSTDAHFDGTHYLCPGCRQRVGPDR